MGNLRTTTAMVGAVAAMAAMLAAGPEAGASLPRLEAGGGDPAATAARRQRIWRADMEGGTLTDWYRSGGGGMFNSGGGVGAPSRERAHGGAWSVRAALAGGEGGVRLFRWGEPHRHRTLMYSAWYLIPRSYQLRGREGRWWILNEFKASTPGRDHNDPFWYVSVNNRRGRLIAHLSWGYQSRLEGPHRGQHGWRDYGRATLPIGRWFRISMRLRQSSAFDGAVTAWVAGKRIARLRGVRTGWPSCIYNAWCVDQGWAATSYTDGLSPAPAPIFVDDAEIRR
jgi:hypothetical protein